MGGSRFNDLSFISLARPFIVSLSRRCIVSLVATRKTILHFSLVSALAAHACLLLFFARPRPLSDVRLHLRVRILGDRGRAEPELYCRAFEKLVILEPRA